MRVPRRFRLPRCLCGIILATIGLPVAGSAAPRLGADPDFESAAPAARTVPPTSAEQHGPPGLVGSPLAVPDQPSGPLTRARFKMRDGEVLVAEVLAFDGQMYALRLPHATLLVRKDLFTAITPLPTITRSAHAIR